MKTIGNVYQYKREGRPVERVEMIVAGPGNGIGWPTVILYSENEEEVGRASELDSLSLMRGDCWSLIYKAPKKEGGLKRFLRFLLD